MTLVFGTLIQGFVNFEMTVLQAHSGDLQAQNHLPAAAVEFRHSSAKTASYLVYMGKLNLQINSKALPKIFCLPRHCPVLLHFHFHERVGVYRGDRCEAA